MILSQILTTFNHILTNIENQDSKLYDCPTNMQSTEDISPANEKRKPIFTDNRETKALKIMMSDDKVTAKNELMETSLQQINDEEDD